MARTQEQRKADTRARLLASAADLFARKGFHAVSAEAVADAADRTTGALYSHFGGKEGLLLALLEAWKEQTAADLLAGLDAHTGLDERLGAIWQSLSGAYGERSDAWLLLEMELWLHGARDPELAGPLAERFADARASLGEGLQRWAAEVGAELPRPVDELTVQVLALLIGAGVQHRLDPSAVPEASVIAGLRELLGLEDDERHDERRLARSAR